jgi:hypothetical protein
MIDQAPSNPPNPNDPKHSLSSVYPVRAAWNRATGAKVVVDDRTFNPEWHTDTDPKASAP